MGKSFSEYKTVLIIVGITALITLQLKSCFTASPPNEKLIRAEIELEKVEEKRKADSLIFVKELAAKNMEIEYLKQQDTVIVERINASNDRIKKIPVTVRNLSNEDLRRAINNFKQ